MAFVGIFHTTSRYPQDLRESKGYVGYDMGYNVGCDMGYDTGVLPCWEIFWLSMRFWVETGL